MKNKKLLLIAAAGMLLLTGCKDASSAAPESVPEQSAAETPETEPVSSEPEEKVMVTLGDSISFGYGMDDYDNERYSGIVCNTLTASNGMTIIMRSPETTAAIWYSVWNEAVPSSCRRLTALSCISAQIICSVSTLTI